MVNRSNLIQKLSAVGAVAADVVAADAVAADAVAVPGGSVLEMTVAKEAGPVATSVGVSSTGNDEQHFSDSDLTPGPARKELEPANTYSILWDGAFADQGSATLHVRVLDAAGNVLFSQDVTVQGERGDVFFRLVLVP